MRHPEARLEAIDLVQTHDGNAKTIVEKKLDDRLARGDVDDALRLDQVRREIERVHGLAGEE